MTGIDSKSKTLVECILKRQGGSIVKFGYHGAKAIVYKFVPLDDTDPDSPHVADVTNDEHYNRLIGIVEGYRPYDPNAEYEEITAIPSGSVDGKEGYSTKNDMEDILSVDAQTISNEWLQEYAKTILKVTQKQALADLATSRYQIEFDYQTTTANDIIRLILIERQAEEKTASETNK